MTISKYLSQEYAAKDFNFPYAQAIRGELNPAHCGYFVPLAQAEKAGWKNIDGTEMTEYTYNSGKTEVGVLMTKPRMVITPICQLGAFDRQASQTEETLVVLGEWDRTKHSSDPNVGNFQIFLVMFLAPNNKLLHDVPLKLMAKGSHQATLSQQWEQSCISVARCQAEANKTMFAPRDHRYKALCVFQPIIIRKLVGNGKLQSPSCYVDGYVKPTVLNWTDFFLGTDEALADAVIGIFNPQPRKLLLPPTAGTIVLALAPEPEDSARRTLRERVLQIETVTTAPANGLPSAPAIDNSNAIDVASSPVAQESTPAPTSPASAATETKPAPEPEYIDPPEFEEDEFEEDEVEEDRIPF
jgi:hypothetical protein